MIPLNQRSITELTTTELRRWASLVGKTPLQPIHLHMRAASEADTHRRTVHLKLEGLNPTGSMKDRTGYALLQSMEVGGQLNSDSTIIESTSGNLGVALAFQCKARGYPFIAVIDPKTTEENMSRMRAFGAQLDMVDQQDAKGGYLLSRLARVQERCLQCKQYVWTDQYSNPANPYIHYTTTGPEIYQQMNGRVDAVFVPVSTGGTLAGIGRFFREASPATCIVGVDAYGSIIFGDLPAPRRLTGIGSSRRSSFLSSALYDTHILVHDEEAFVFCRELYRETGIKVGGSSGAVLAACTRYLQMHPSLCNVVCVCADNGANYESSIFNDEWIYQQDISLTVTHLGNIRAITVGERIHIPG